MFLFVDDHFKSKGQGSIVLGNPLNVLAWLANTLPRYGRNLRADAFVTTGVCMDVYTARVGQSIMADFGALGQVSLAIN